MSSTKLRLKRRFGSFMQRYNHSMPIFCQILGAPTPTSSTLSTTLVHDANQLLAFILMLLETKGRRMSTDHHLAPNLLIDMFHSLGSNTLLGTKQEVFAVSIILMIHIIRGEEAGTRNRFLNWNLQQRTEQVEDFAVTHHPFRLQIHIIKLIVLLKLNQMVKIRSHKNTLLQILQKFLTSNVQNIYI